MLLVFLQHVAQNDDDWNIRNHGTDWVAPNHVRRERLRPSSRGQLVVALKPDNYSGRLAVICGMQLDHPHFSLLCENSQGQKPCCFLKVQPCASAENLHL